MIFHYTSQEGFKGIVREDGIHFWFSDARYMNDKNEMLDAWPLFIRAAKELSEEGKIAKEIYDIIKEIDHDRDNGSKITYMYAITTQKEVKIIKVREEGIFHRYICCFCQEPDSLFMWSRYQKDNRGGYAIGVSLDEYWNIACEIVGKEQGKIRKLRSDEVFGTVEVEYQNKDKIMFFKKSILAFQRQMHRSKDEYDRSQNILSLQKYVNESAMFCKNHKFADEKEVRMIVTLRSPDDPNVNKTECDDIRYREAHGLKIPYVEICIPKKEYLKTVVLSPTFKSNKNEEERIEEVRDYLKKMGYTHDIDIRCSEIPL